MPSDFAEGGSSLKLQTGFPPPRLQSGSKAVLVVSERVVSKDSQGGRSGCGVKSSVSEPLHLCALSMRLMER